MGYTRESRKTNSGSSDEDIAVGGPGPEVEPPAPLPPVPAASPPARIMAEYSNSFLERHTSETHRLKLLSCCTDVPDHIVLPIPPIPQILRNLIRLIPRID